MRKQGTFGTGRKSDKGGKGSKKMRVGRPGKRSERGPKATDQGERPVHKNKPGKKERAARKAKLAGFGSTAGLDVCPIALKCGGCTRLGVDYQEQLATKQRYVTKLFDGVAPEDCLLEPIAGMMVPFAFRDKIASPFAPDRKALSRWRKQRGKTQAGKGKGKAKHPSIPREAIQCGLFATGTHRIVPVPSCPVEHPMGRTVISAVQQLMARFGIEPYDEDNQTGFMRYCVVRVGHESGEVLVTLVTAEDKFPGAKNFCHELVKLCPEITTIIQNVNPQVTNAIFGNVEHTLYGPGFILDTLSGLSFRISSHSFYQVNAVQTEVLYRIAMRFAGLDDFQAPVVVDAYCGTGTIGLVAASQAEGARIIGVDKVESAIADARGNARHNGIENVEFVAEDAGPFMRRLAAEGEGVDVLFMDPPRAGSSREFLDAVATLAPGRVVYISCNPETQVRDCRILRKSGYKITRMRPVDMFPHTDHVENVVLLEREGGSEE